MPQVIEPDVRQFGAQFEGMGIAPDEQVHTSATDLKTGRDPVLLRGYLAY
jgi:hypothetical protein